MLLLFAALLAPDPAPSGGEARSAGARDSDRLVCRDLVETGSRLARRRICMSRLAWAEYKRLQRSELERMQVNGGDPNAD
jgi:hypothetical protein